MTKTELKQNITKIKKLLRSDSYEAGIELIKTLDDPEITKGTLKAVATSETNVRGIDGALETQSDEFHETVKVVLIK